MLKQLMVIQNKKPHKNIWGQTNDTIIGGVKDF